MRAVCGCSSAVYCRSVMVFRSGTDLLSLLILFFFCSSFLLDDLFKKLRLCRFKWDQDEIWKEYSSSKYAPNNESDFRLDIIISRWRPWLHFTQKSAATWSVNTKRLHAARLCSSFRRTCCIYFVSSYCTNILTSYYRAMLRRALLCHSEVVHLSVCLSVRLCVPYVFHTGWITGTSKIILRLVS